VRPDPADLANYHIDRLIDDVLALADACGSGTTPFHLVGHDWGGQVAWFVAGKHPERVKSLSILSRPHPAAFRKAFKEDASGQKHRSRHHKAFHDPNTGMMLTEDGCARLRKRLADSGVPPASIDDYVSVLGEPGAIEGALAWYRAAGAIANMEIGQIMTPTLYLWGDKDESVGRSAAEWTSEYVMGVYQLAVIAGGGHFLTDQAPELVTKLLLDHIGRAQ